MATISGVQDLACVPFSLVGLLTTNVASLVSVRAYDLMHKALWRALSLGGQAVADRALANSLRGKLDQYVKVKTAELDAENKVLDSKYRRQTLKLDQARAKTIDPA